MMKLLLLPRYYYSRQSSFCLRFEEKLNGVNTEAVGILKQLSAADPNPETWEEKASSDISSSLMLAKIKAKSAFHINALGLWNPSSKAVFEMGDALKIKEQNVILPDMCRVVKKNLHDTDLWKDPAFWQSVKTTFAKENKNEGIYGMLANMGVRGLEKFLSDEKQCVAKFIACFA